MFKNAFRLLPLLLLSISLSCHHTGDQTKSGVNEDSLRKARLENFDHTYDDITRYIAGLPLREKSSIPASLQNVTWKKYCRDMDTAWSKMENTRLLPMRNWAKANLKDAMNNERTMFYPFSGPDMVNVYQFFPNDSLYILMAMEFPGSLPQMKKMDSTHALRYLWSVRGALNDLFNRSYFITSYMSKGVSQDARGTVPVICLFLARTGNTIIDIRKYHLNNDGTTTPLASDSSLIGIKNDFAEIYFRKNGSEKVQKVIYISCNLSNDTYPDNKSIIGLTENKALYNWMQKISDCNTYLKAASYLPHNPFMSMVRDLILAKSKVILQDDTGVPFSYLTDDKWNVSFYGNYSAPIKDFPHGYYQPDLRKAYDKGPVGKMDFSLGYHAQDQKNQNLIMAIRK